MSRRSSGFTLIEILVVVAIMGLILVMITQGVHVGLRGADSFYRAVQMQSDMEPVERALRQMIERMDPGMYPDPPQVRGSASAIVFTTELPDPTTGGTLTADVRLQADDGRMVLWWTPHTGGIPFNAPPPPRREILLDGVARLDISYAAKGAGAIWLSSWSRPAVPGLVRLRVIPQAGARAWPPIIVDTQREQAEE
jgi:prepilin-type N-terminal cleavage/methylation domain-containing protein